MPGLARWISTVGDKEEKRLAELDNIMVRWERRDRREPTGALAAVLCVVGKTEHSSMANLPIATGKDKFEIGERCRLAAAQTTLMKCSKADVRDCLVCVPQRG